MKILFLCTAHNSLSQRLYLTLSTSHDVTVEYALSQEVVISAVVLARPDLIICPFLTTHVPKQIYEKFLTLIIHPGPPGDAGPSALDWVLLGDNGTIEDANELINSLDKGTCHPGRPYWGVSVLQAIEEFDAGPVWAFEQFALDIDQPGLTKSQLYRGSITEAAVTATLAAVYRIQDVASGSSLRGRQTGRSQPESSTSNGYSPSLKAQPDYGRLSVTTQMPFQGGKLHCRPLLKAAERNFDIGRHDSQQISRRIRCGDSQPGVLSDLFGPKLYIYGGIIDDNIRGLQPRLVLGAATKILGTRNSAVCIATSDGKGLWITHIRQPKTKSDKALWPKVPATYGLIELGVLTLAQTKALHWPAPCNWSLSTSKTFQEVWVDIDMDDNDNTVAYLYFDFYNGAMGIDQCSQLIEAMEYVLSRSTADDPVHALVLMGGSYFSNGIALNIIEAASDPSEESWLNINRIDDVVHYLLHEFPTRNILTFAAIRGNAAAGGVALAAACDVVIAGCSVVLNPAYRAIGLYGSEYHTLSYFARCGEKNAKKMLRAMTPMSPLQAQSIGLVDYIFPGTGQLLEDRIRYHVSMLLKPGILKGGYWKAKADTSPTNLARIRAAELGEMSKDFWSPRSIRYHSRRFDFVRKIKATQTPLRFAKHRRQLPGHVPDDEDTCRFDDVEYYRRLDKQQLRVSCSTDASTSKAARGAKKRPSLVNTVGRQDSGYADEVTLFPCYYRPIDDVLTPPASPTDR